MTVIMPFVITMIIVVIFFMVIMIVVVIIMVAMIVFMFIVAVVAMIPIVVMIVVIFFIILLMIIIVIIDVNLAVKVLSFSPNKSRSNRCLNDKRAAVAKTPLENTTKHPIDGVVPGIPLKVGVKSTVTFDGDDGREVEFTGFKGLSTTMGAVGKSCGTCRKRKG